ncbi:hypothetical protein Q7C18_16325 [Nesterenkonia sp. CL21]|uniref:hypothetical protein n=1 Tax=Nesterenkonia sp. CL21 TaxID=3064894 RepID=UPI002878EF12|nr:hypothetical protein [Nesterenkonia sp. CL21]MDS2174272.1 hypothetical protein [Nesterenkonia sp. CL21]
MRQGIAGAGATGPAPWWVALTAAALLLTACSSPQAEAPEPPEASEAAAPSDTSDSSVAAPEAVIPTEEEILEHVAGAVWELPGVGPEPELVPLHDGERHGDALGRSDVTYELGDEPVVGDIDGDGIPDVVLDILRVDGNGYQVHWFVWLGQEMAEAEDEPAVQVLHPVGRGARCGDWVEDVQAQDGALTVTSSLRLPEDACAEPGSAEASRTLTIEEFDGEPVPVQVEPLSAWGGVCPFTEHEIHRKGSQQVLTAPSPEADVAATLEEIPTSIGIQGSLDDDGAFQVQRHGADEAYALVTFPNPYLAEDRHCGFVALEDLDEVS